MTRAHLASLAVASAALSVALAALMHWLNPEPNDSDAISEYALGDYGFLMNVAFVAAGVAFAALAATLPGRVQPTRSARAAIVLLVVAAVGWVLLGVGNVDREGAEQTAHGVIHGIGFVLGFPSMFLALLLLGRAFGSDARWRPFRRTILTIAIAAVLSFILAFSDVVSPVTMRLSELLVLTGVVLTALRASRAEPRVAA